MDYVASAELEVELTRGQNAMGELKSTTAFFSYNLLYFFNSQQFHKTLTGQQAGLTIMLFRVALNWFLLVIVVTFAAVFSIFIAGLIFHFISIFFLLFRRKYLA